MYKQIFQEFDNSSRIKSFFLRHKFKLVLGGCGIFIAALLAGVLTSVLNNFCTGENDPIVFQKSFTFDAVSDQQFSLTNIDGKGSFVVKVVHSNDSKIKFDIDLHSNDKGLADKLTVSNKLENSKQILQFLTKFSFDSCYLAVIAMQIPKDLSYLQSFEATVQKGSLKFDGANFYIKSLKVDVIDGSLDITNLNGDLVNLSSEHGSVNFSQLKFNSTQVQSKDGSVKGKQFQTTSLVAKSDSGSLDFQIDKVKNLDSFTDDGSLLAEISQVDDNSTINLKSNQGSVTLKLLNSYSGTFNLKANDGSVAIKSDQALIYSENNVANIQGSTKEASNNTILINVDNGSGKLEF